MHEKQCVFYALAVHFNLTYPDPNIEGKPGKRGSTSMRAEFPKLIANSGWVKTWNEMGPLYRTIEWREAYELCGWPADEVVRALDAVPGEVT